MTRRLQYTLLSLLALAQAHAQPDLLSREAIITRLELVADWQFQHPARWKHHQWHNAAFYSGAMALAKISASPRFLDQLVQLGEANGWQLGPRVYHADDHAVGQTYAELFLLRGDGRMIQPMRERFDFILAHRRTGSLLLDKQTNPTAQERWAWCDALFMAPPAWLRLWAATDHRPYLEFAVSEWWATSDYLYDQEEHLYYRDSNFFDRRERNGRKIFWSRGNGWVLAGLVRMLQFLPADHPQRARFVGQFREMAAKVASCQQADGFWRASLLDPASYPTPETSGTGFYCYALAWGVNEGLLDRSHYTPLVLRAWAALNSRVTAEGKLTNVQPVGAAAQSFDEASTEPYGVGAFLLAGSEVYRLQP